MIRKLVALCLAFVYVGSVNAQELTRTGTVTDGFGSVIVDVQILTREPERKLSPIEPGQPVLVTLSASYDYVLTSADATDTFRATGRADANGKITFDRLPLGGYVLYAESGRFSGESSFYLNDYRHSLQVSLYMQLGQSFEGRILNEQAEAVSGALVRFFPDSGDTRANGISPPMQFVTTTGENGDYAHPSLWGSEEWAYHIDAEGYVPILVQDVPFAELPSVIVLSQGKAMTGDIVQSGTGAPVAGARVRLRQARGFLSFQSTTDAAGKFQFTNIGTGTYTLTFEHELWAPESSYRAIDMSDASPPEDIRLLAVRGATLRGRVFDRATQQGIPAVEIVVRGHTLGARSATVVSDKDGYYEATGLNTSEYSVERGQSEAYAHDFQHDKKTIDVVVGETMEGVDFPMDRGSLVSGRVLDVDGTPLPGIPVAASGNNPDPYTIYKAAVTTNERGEFTIGGFAPGAEVWLNARREGYSVLDPPKLVIGESDMKDVELILSPTTR